MNSSRIRIALVEDHTPTRDLLSAWIAEAPDFACVAACGDVESALTRLPDANPEVILLDVNLPGLSGVEGAPRLKELMPAAQIMMLTVYEDSEHVFAALKAGATGYMLKETPREELLAAARQVHAGGSPMSGHIARKVVQHFQAITPSPLSDSTLSAREQEVLRLLARGFLYKEIADQTQLSTHTVATYIRRIYEKLHVHTRTEAVTWYLERGREGSDSGAPGRS